MFQTCPVCKGSGYNYSGITQNVTEKCNVCDGKKIISELTGLSPNFDKNAVERQRILDLTNKPIVNYPNTYKQSFPSTDFRDNNMETQQEYFGK